MSTTSPTQDVPPESPVPTGLLAGRYQVLSLLGRGAMGDVYQARHVHAGRIVALKVVNASSAGNERICERVRAEAQACSAARHPNIVEVFDAGELEDGRPYVAMEFLEGRRLLDLFESDGPLPIKRACQILADVARALGAAHKVGIVHRDLKAENVMLVEKDGALQVKVLDFGIAAAVYREGGRVTLPGIGIGTPEYMAPEQVYGADPTPRFDIYALGVLMYEALTGTLPFSGDQPSAILQRKATTPAPPISSRREDLPSALAKLIDECLALEPENRPAAVEEIVRVLDSYTSSEAPILIDDEPPARSKTTLIAAAAGLFAVATAILLWPKAEEPTTLVASSVERSAAASEAGPTEEPKPAEIEVKPEPRPEPAPVATPTEIAAPPVATPTPTPSPKTPKKPSAPEPAVTKPSVPPPVAETDESDTEACVRRRAEAVDAREAHAWASLLKATSKSACWSSQKDRTRMRVKALLELLRFEECVAAAGSSTDPEVVRDAKICAKRAAAVPK